MRSGFPHSDISGSKLHCQLPGAFRRLARPSSPDIAKASTTCTYSLDPITLRSLSRSATLQATHLCNFSPITAKSYRCNYNRIASLGLSAADDTTFFHFVKERTDVPSVRSKHWPQRLLLTPDINSWWRMTGSNRRPPACKAGALPAELIPR